MIIAFARVGHDGLAREGYDDLARAGHGLVLAQVGHGLGTGWLWYPWRRLVMALARAGYGILGVGMIMIFLVWDGCDDGTYLQTPHAIVLKKMISTTPYHDSVY